MTHKTRSVKLNSEGRSEVLMNSTESSIEDAQIVKIFKASKKIRLFNVKNHVKFND
jgi:hypothetical protein